MLFNSFSFALFLLAVLVIAAALRHWCRPVWVERLFLVLASAFFYAQWNWHYLILIYITITTDFLIVRYLISRARPRLGLWISMIVNLGILAVFKYAGFIGTSVNDLMTTVNIDYSVTVLELLLPVGISFYTFQSLSYTIDSYRDQMKPRRSLIDYALFVSFFPQLVAGPIVRASEFFQQLDRDRRIDFDAAQTGLLLIVIGLLKKVVFADQLALIADPVFASPETASSFEILIGTYAFAFQIYFDFSGYSDIAIGTAALLGFRFPRNFAHPYIALSFRDFWRRWHMTLSRWLRDYLYISLGGNRKGRWRTSRNLFLTMLLGGLWHGASWNFVFWGMLHGLYLAAERLWVALSSRMKGTSRQSDVSGDERHGVMIQPVQKLIRWLLVFHAICFAWIFFRADSFADSLLMIQSLTQWQSSGTAFAGNSFAVLFVLAMPVLHWIGSSLDLTTRAGQMSTLQYSAVIVTAVIIMVVFAPGQSDPFIYFQF